MSNLITGNQKHLILGDRLYIEKCLNGIIKALFDIKTNFHLNRECF